MLDERLSAHEDGRRLGYAARDAVLEIPFYERGQARIVERGHCLCGLDSVIACKGRELVVKVVGPGLLDGGHDVPPVRETELGLDFREVTGGDGGLSRPGVFRQREITVDKRHALRISGQNL